MSNDDLTMTNQGGAKGTQKFDLEERTAKFGEAVIAFARTVGTDHISRPLLSQLVRAAGSVGANSCEADEAASKKEFRYRIALCKREARESKHWLRMLVAACPDHRESVKALWQEANELTKIFALIHRSSDRTETR